MALSRVLLLSFALACAQAAPAHPAEHALDLPYADLLELQAAVHKMGETAAKDVRDDFIIFPLRPRP